METCASGQTALFLFLRHNFATLHEDSQIRGYITHSVYGNLYKIVLLSLL
jgi:hypothetical protein